MNHGHFMKRLDRMTLKAVACVTAFALFGCEDAQQETNRQNATSWGPVMPLRVGADGLTFPASDLLMPGESVVHVVYSSSVGATDTLALDGDIITLQAAPESGVGNLELVLEQGSRNVPVLSRGEVRYTFRHRTESSSVGIVGDLNGWTPQPMVPSETDPMVFEHDAIFSPGKHPYQLVLDGEWSLDPSCEEKLSNGMGGWNSVVTIPTPDAPQLTSFLKDNKVFIQCDAEADLVVYIDDMLAYHGAIPKGGVLPIAAEGFGPGRHHMRAWAAQGGGIGQDLLIPMEGSMPVTDVAQLSRQDWETATMYFLMVDRFHNGNPSNDEPVEDDAIMPQANHQGGDLEGVVAKLEEGYFDALGMNTIWVSPITANAEGAWGYWQDSARTDVVSKFSGYHGYWPISNTRVDRRLGSREAMDDLVEKAHAAGQNVVLDYVANHVHQDHPLMAVHPDWGTELYLPDGSLNTERWDEYRLTTWFDTFMPTLDLERPEVAEAMSDSAAWWGWNSDIDGFRHDATKHIPESFWRLLTQKIKDVHATTGKRLFQIGETYGSPKLIGSYLSSGMLDAQFDFNLYDKAVGAIAFDEGSWQDLIQTNQESLRAYGAHHLMGNITGNQDRPRFTSLADGTLDVNEDMKFQGWTRDIQHGDVVGYKRMQLLTAYLMSVPGIPCVYYGDEIADVGGNDPDNRRMMRFDGLNEQETQTREWLGTWASMRRSRMSMTYGTTSWDEPQEGLLHIKRTYLTESTHVLLNRTGAPLFIPSDLKQPNSLLAGSMTEDGMVPPYGAIAFGNNTQP